MDSDDHKAGRDRIRRDLFGRLDDAGVKPPRGDTREKYDQMRARLCFRLAYLDPENLLTLAESVLDAAATGGGRCPAEVVILGWARGLQAPPLQELRIVSSWLASIEGPKAAAGGYLVELYRLLRSTGRPPSPWALRQVREEAESSAHARRVIEEKIARGVASADDRVWLQAYLRDEEAAQRIVETGNARRAGQKEAAE